MTGSPGCEVAALKPVLLTVSWGTGLKVRTLVLEISCASVTDARYRMNRSGSCRAW